MKTAGCLHIRRSENLESRLRMYVYLVRSEGSEIKEVKVQLSSAPETEIGLNLLSFSLALVHRYYFGSHCNFWEVKNRGTLHLVNFLLKYANSSQQTKPFKGMCTIYVFRRTW